MSSICQIRLCAELSNLKTLILQPLAAFIVDKPFTHLARQLQELDLTRMMNGISEVSSLPYIARYSVLDYNSFLRTACPSFASELLAC